MPLKRNTAREIPVILIDSTDFITGLTPVVFGDVTCKYRKDASTTWVTKSITAGNWKINTNKPAGNYAIDFTGTELNTNGLFEFNVVVAGAIPYSGLFEIRDNTNDSLGTKVDTINTNVDTIVAKLPTNNIMGSSDKTDKDDEIDAIKAKTDNLPADPASETNASTNTTTITDQLDEIGVKVDGLASGDDLTIEKD